MAPKSDSPSSLPSAEMIGKLTEFANMLAWKSPDLNVLYSELVGQYPPLAETLQEHLQRSHARGRLVLPDLRAFGNQTIAIFADYGGETGSSKFLTYSTLVCGWNLAGPFLNRMKVIRASHKLGDKEISFKDFRMGQLLRAIPDFLSAANGLPGFLFTLVIDKKLQTLFGPNDGSAKKSIADMLSNSGLGERKPDVNEKLLRVVHVAAFLAGLLAHDGQKIFWMTDHDAISANEDMHDKTLQLFDRVLGMYARKGHTFPLLGGALPFAERSLDTLDLLSLPDVVAGCIDQYLTQRESVAAADIKVKAGCDSVLQWLANDGIGLKKMTVLMRLAAGGGIQGATLEFSLVDPPVDATVISVVI